jgi:hypothetical protein
MRIPRYQNPEYISISKREGILWNIRQDERQKWSEGILNGLNSEFLTGPTREFSIRNLDELLVIALNETLVLEVVVETESSTREFLLNPRRGMSAVCMCKLENIENSTTLRLIDDSSEFIIVKGHLGTALIEITDTVLKYLVEKSRRGEPSDVPIQALIDLAIMSIESNGNLKLYWVAPPECEQHPVLAVRLFCCRNCRTTNPIFCSC